MRIIIEEHKYAASDVKGILKGIDALENIEGYISVNYVGYFYNTNMDVRDCVFILPKVLLEDVDGKELVFGKYTPEEIINLDAHNPLTQQEKDFIYEFAVWIYRAIVVFHNDKRNKTSIVYHKKIVEVGKGKKHLSNTFLDILLSLIQFNKDNQDFFFYVLRNIHAGFNKINWNRTIATSPAIIQNGDAVYLQPINKKRQINFDEELLVIFFSILNYISECYGFSTDINCNFELITGRQFKVYMNGVGKARLKQIKYKYFSDKALQLWDLCYAFFDAARQIHVSTEQKEYLLVKNFNIVFESIIDELIGDRDIPAGLKEQDDGKRIDHLYSYQGLTSQEEDKPVYYIGDSKYYKRNHKIGKESVYKQFTYARNIIQWNLNIFMNNDLDDEELQYDKKNFGKVPKLRDDVTEGYNVIPNFFISAKLNKDLSYKDEVELTDRRDNCFSNRHFENRLFDRDSLLICHYDVNFLYVVSLYARNSRLHKDAWKKKIRETFRSEIQKMLEDKFQFYVMTPHADVVADEYFRENFQMVLGKVFTPFKDKDYYSVALDRDEKFREENEALLDLLKQNFEVKECSIGVDPSSVLEKIPRKLHVAPAARFLTQHWLENYMDANIVVGCYKSQEHLDWILGKNDKGTLLYNVRLDKNRAGAQLITQTRERKVSFVVLYDIEDVAKEPQVFRVHHTAVMDEARMRLAQYPNPQGRYFCYVFDEEVSLGKLDVAEFLSQESIKDGYVKGAPIYVKGEELIKFRM